MRCPYCNGFNSDHATACSYCGRDLTSARPGTKQPVSQQQAPQPPNQQPRAPQPQQPVPRPTSTTPARPTSTSVPRGTVQPAPNTRLRSGQSAPLPATPFAPSISSAPPAPEPPAPFPSRTLAELQALEPGALSYNVVSSDVGDGRKKIVRIAYPSCAAWQQAATLLKALKVIVEGKEQQEAQFESIIVQGVFLQGTDAYAFTNGQLTFDRNIRLGSQTMNRYLVETGNGLESDSVRIVITE